MLSPSFHAVPRSVSSRLPAGLLQMSERDCIAVMFCGSHKTLAFGIPLIKVRLLPGMKLCRLGLLAFLRVCCRDDEAFPEESICLSHSLAGFLPR